MPPLLGKAHSFGRIFKVVGVGWHLGGRDQGKLFGPGPGFEQLPAHALGFGVEVAGGGAGQCCRWQQTRAQQVLQEMESVHECKLPKS